MSHILKKTFELMLTEGVVSVGCYISRNLVIYAFLQVLCSRRCKNKTFIVGLMQS
jgi:hypothetical protein